MKTGSEHWSARSVRNDRARYVASGEWRARTLIQSFQALTAEDSNRVAIVQGNVTLKRSEVLTRARALAAALRALGIRAHDVVSFMLPNWPETAIIDVAAGFLGAIINPIVPIYRSAEVRFILSDCRARALVIPEYYRNFDYVQMMRGIRDSVPELRDIIVARSQREHEGMISFEALLGAQPIDDPVKQNASAIKLVLYTSGTTGTPKGVLHSHETIGAEISNVSKHWKLTDADTVFMPSPVTHITGYLYGIQLPMTVGMPTVYLDQWNPREAFALLEQYKCAFTVAATPFLAQLSELARDEKRNLPALRYFACGGAPVSPQLIEDASEVFTNCVVCRVYGSTEAPTITLGPVSRDLVRAAETDGVIVGHRVRLVRADGEEAGPGEEGEVRTRSAELFLGYTDPAATSEAFDKDNYFCMGDLARVDYDNCLTITGRLKDMIIRGGENISSKEIEDTLHRHSAVQESAVVAMPHKSLGETTCAFIIARKGLTVTLHEITDFFASQGLAKQKTPERIFIVDEFPRTAAGKIKKIALREEVARILAHERANYIARDAAK